jgi:hypothetical protein
MIQAVKVVYKIGKKISDRENTSTNVEPSDNYPNTVIDTQKEKKKKKKPLHSRNMSHMSTVLDCSQNM